MSGLSPEDSMKIAKSAELGKSDPKLFNELMEKGKQQDAADCREAEQEVAQLFQELETMAANEGDFTLEEGLQERLSQPLPDDPAERWLELSMRSAMLDSAKRELQRLIDASKKDSDRWG